MPAIKIDSRSGIYSGGRNHTDVLIAMSRQMSAQRIRNISALVNNSGGVSSGNLQAVAAFVAAANAGGNLAGKTTSDAALVTVRDAIKELVAKINAVNTSLSLPLITDNTGGAATDNTVDAVTQSVTGAATGAQLTETNAARVAINDAFSELTYAVNAAAVATGVGKLKVTKSTDFPVHNGTAPVIGVSTGTAADPGITKAAFDAALVKWANNVAIIAAKIIQIQTAPAQVIVI